jgi:hypothetical protein
VVAKSIEGDWFAASGTLDGGEYLGYSWGLSARIRIKERHIKEEKGA